MLPLIQREVVDRKGWIDEEEFLNMIALAQAAPGLIAVNSAIFIGWRVGGWKGVCGAVLGAVLPSFLIILAIAMLFREWKELPAVEAAFKGIRPVVVSLILVPMVKMARTSCRSVWTWLTAIVSLLLVAFLNVSPIYIILCVLVLGFSLTWFRDSSLRSE